MGRRKIEVDCEHLKKTIAFLEKENKYENRSALYKDVGIALNVSPSIIPLRVAEFQIPLLTPLGKRGRPNGVFINTKNRTRKKKQADPHNIAQLRRDTPPKYQKLIDKIEKGSLKATLKLKCLECTDYQPKEIAECPCKCCPIYSWRAFKKTNETAEKETAS